MVTVYAYDNPDRVLIIYRNIHMSEFFRHYPFFDHDPDEGRF